jgi:hypothetical protein
MNRQKQQELDPWPDNPRIPDLIPYDPAGDLDEDAYQPSFEPPPEEEIDETNTLMLRRQRLFRWGAQSIAVVVSELPEVEKIIAFGAVAEPLNMEVPRFREFRRNRIEVFHECADLDLAIWMTRLDQLKNLNRAINRGLRPVQLPPYGGIAHHQVDVLVFDVELNRYRGRLCSFGECPKQGKRQCLVPGCGAQPFLQQFEKYRFHPAQFEDAPKVTLLDRTSGFLVRMPFSANSA